MRFGTGVALGGAIGLLLAGTAMATPADNKASALNAMTDMASKRDPTGIDRYFTTPYYQHNSRIPDGFDALKKLAQEQTAWKGVSFTSYRALADKDLVLLHSVYYNLRNRGLYRIAFDMFRFNKAGKIVEHWDALDDFDPQLPGPDGLTQANGETKITDRAKTEANRAVAKAFVEAAYIKPDLKRAEAFLSKALIDHHKGQSQLHGPAGEGKDATYLKIHNVVAEGNFVFVQSEGRLHGDTILELYDLFRLKGGEIVEHWDVRQAVDKPSEWANPHGPFVRNGRAAAIAAEAR